MKDLRKLTNQRKAEFDIKKALPAIIVISVIFLVIAFIFGGSFLGIFFGIIIFILVGLGTVYLLKQTNQLPTNYRGKKRVTIEEIPKGRRERMITEVEILGEDE
ncbi:MAG: hypothetical protein GF308_03515 [Candidatus Heimdallarchaeota archaeon]|nr:hypothetical protein [Candidatus Heimdallarchaeota archaeon]